MTLEVIARVDVPDGAEQGVKEKLATDFERYGDARIVSVRVLRKEQMRIGDDAQK